MDSDEALVKRTQAGELAAFELLVRRHRLAVYRVAARIVGEADADDVTQDAFLRAFHRVGRFRGEAPFRAWLLRIAHNAALTSLSRRRPVAVGAPDEPELGAEEAPRVRTPVEQLVQSERRDRLSTKLELLSPAHRTALVLRDLEGLTYDEIAVITEAPLGSVKGRLHRARRELIQILRDNTYDWELPE